MLSNNLWIYFDLSKGQTKNGINKRAGMKTLMRGKHSKSECLWVEVHSLYLPHRERETSYLCVEFMDNKSSTHRHVNKVYVTNIALDVFL